MKKRSMKQRITVLLMASVLLVSMVFMLALNVAMRLYVEQEAKRAIALELKQFQAIETTEAVPLESSDAENTTTESRDLVHATVAIGAMEKKPGIFYVYSTVLMDEKTAAYDQGYPNFTEYFVSTEEYRVQTYAKSHMELLEEGQIVAAQLDGAQVYLSTLRVSWPTEEAQDESEVWIFYVNTASVFHIMDLLNVIFLIILILCALGAIFAGIRAGVTIENAEQKLKRFFENASHELKTPLMSIQGYAEALQTGVITDTQMATQVILEQSDRMSVLVEELLYLSKLESGEVVLEQQAVDVCELLDGCLASIEAMACKKGLSLQVSDLEKAILTQGDAKQLSKLFMTVLSNALKHAHHSISVSVSAVRPFVVLSIRDDGDGIRPEDLPHIFERFYAGSGGSTGVGLSLAKEIVTLHKGSIEANSSSDGAEFIIQLPLYYVK